LTPYWRKKRTQEASVRLLTDLLNAYSPSGKEAAVADRLIKEMRKMGYQTKMDSAGNAIGEIGKGTPSILLCGHMDTVPGQIPVRIENGKLYGRGAVDAKGPLAAMVMAAAEAHKIEPNVKVTVVGVVEEEGTSRGIKQLISEGIEADYAIFGEPSHVENITIGYKGSLRLKLTFKTQGGHSSAPWLYENAIEKTFELWQQIKDSIPSIEKQGTPYSAVTLCLIKITGGKDSSAVPSKSEALIDARIPPSTTPDQVLNRIQDVIKQFQQEHPKVTIKFEIEDSNEPFEADKTSPLVRALSLSIRKIRNKQVTLLHKTGTGDMNILGHAMNVPIVTYGPGDSHLDHTKDENIEVKEYLDSISILKETIIRLSQVHKKEKA
jgi:[amino group carrier protein]-lysine/ornithine hydrolase